MKQKLLGNLRNLLGERKVISDFKTREKYASDRSFFSNNPEVVVMAENLEDVLKVVNFSSENQIPITPRGLGTAFTGAAVPKKGGILLSLEKMNRILEISKEDFVVKVEPGVITANLQEEVSKHGLFYPPDPASVKECSIGGNIATNAGGPRCLKYGVTKHYVLGLKVVLPNGKLVKLGGRTHKNKVGLNLLDLFVGSEGMLGIVVEITLKLIPSPRNVAVFSCSFSSYSRAINAVNSLFLERMHPSAVELSDEVTLNSARKYEKGAPEGKAHLFLEFDSHSPKKVFEEEINTQSKFFETLVDYPILLYIGPKEVNKAWEKRQSFSYALKATGLIKINQDIVIPRGRLQDLNHFCTKLRKEFGVTIASFGHAGDGNIHVNFLLKESEKALAKTLQKKLFSEVVALGGAITGEHGIGLAKKEFFLKTTSQEVLDLHKTIKVAIDPKGILNPENMI